jgi:hypothetical protein
MLLKYLYIGVMGVKGENKLKESKEKRSGYFSNT